MRSHPRVTVAYTTKDTVGRAQGVVVEVLVLLALLSSAFGMIAALLAFILARAGGKSVYVAVREAGVAFIATTTLAILLLNFVGADSAPHQEPSQPTPIASSTSGQ